MATHNAIVDVEVIFIALTVSTTESGAEEPSTGHHDGKYAMSP